MSIAKFTLMGFNEWFKADNDDLFKHVSMPSNIDRQTVIDTILLKGGEFEPLYTSPVFMQLAIGSWCKRYEPTFIKWSEALKLKYDPIYNFDRTEEYTDKRTTSANTSASSSTDSSGENEGKTSAYDANTYQPHDMSTNTGHAEDQAQTQTAGSEQFEHRARLYGNIGVTTSQQMLQAEYDIALWNVYEHIADLFVQEFCLTIY